jgi:hypothetical protein
MPVLVVSRAHANGEEECTYGSGVWRSMLESESLPPAAWPSSESESRAGIPLSRLSSSAARLSVRSTPPSLTRRRTALAGDLPRKFADDETRRGRGVLARIELTSGLGGRGAVGSFARKAYVDAVPVEDVVVAKDASEGAREREPTPNVFVVLVLACGR